jgi:hypothetical protein
MIQRLAAGLRSHSPLWHPRGGESVEEPTRVRPAFDAEHELRHDTAHGLLERQFDGGRFALITFDGEDVLMSGRDNGVGFERQLDDIEDFVQNVKEGLAAS